MEAGAEAAFAQRSGAVLMLRPLAMHRLFSNLVDNAIDAAGPGGWVELSASSPGGAWELRVADSGYGIPAHHLPRITERFYRVSTSRSRETGGTGLGLSISQSLVTRAGGFIAAESRVGEGSRFRIWLPEAVEL